MDGKNVEGNADAVAERLRGAPGRAGAADRAAGRPHDDGARTVTLARRPVVVPSVEYGLDTVTHPERGPVPVGVIRVSSFQETTAQEVREAIAVLRTGTMTTPGMRGLILDLRGNPGGLFKSAVQVAELFLNEGVIVVTAKPLPRLQPALPRRAA